MGYRTLRACLDDLAATGQLLRIEEEIDPHLEAAAIHRRVYAAGGPALYFARANGSPFPMASNLFGTLERARFLFRDTLARVRQLIELRSDPERALAKLRSAPRLLPGLWHMRPKVVSHGPVMNSTTTIDKLPRLQS